MIEKCDKELAEAQDILAVLPPFGCTTTRVEISIQKVKIKAVLDTGSLVNIVSSKLVKKLKLAPDLNYHQLYGMAGLPMTHAIGSYSALPMQFGKLLLAALAVILENKSYNLLVGTQFLRKYNGIINLKYGNLFIMGYEVPLIFEEPVKVLGKQLKMCALEYVRIDNYSSLENQAQERESNPKPGSHWTAGPPACIFLGFSPRKLIPRRMTHEVKQAKPRNYCTKWKTNHSA
ncbi:DNA damage-inducible protein 1 [Entomophthora muscae]|uniref:DNA damage-inducible protein 1 n=1 Tax=Entomophthora muscae TaxID=34485 RepID=A0ACC2SR27_9FUNG|nr:DNA damage-inducible protein 1 [Entomophthora muscae]